MDEINMSPVKKEKLKKARKNLLKKQMRANLPILDKRDIRRHRLPYHEALISDLEEMNFSNSANLIRQLIDNQENLCDKFNAITTVQSYLIRTQYENLYQGLKKAEKAQKDDNYVKEYNEMMGLAVPYAFNTADYLWLGEQLLLQCLEISKYIESNKWRALSTYLYGKFLLEKASDQPFAKINLEMARNLSLGMHWNASNYLNAKEDTVFVETCILLYKAFLTEAKSLFKIDPSVAVQLCSLARSRASEACHKHGELEALLLKGKCELMLKDTTSAIVTYRRASKLATKLALLTEFCESKIGLTKAYTLHGNLNEGFIHLKELLSFAEKHKMSIYIADAYKYLGEYHLNVKELYLATPLLAKSFELFNQENDMVNREEVRILNAISAGEEALPKYVDLIAKCIENEGKTQAYLMQVIDWKDKHEIFWTVEPIVGTPSEILFVKEVLEEILDAVDTSRIIPKKNITPVTINDVDGKQTDYASYSVENSSLGTLL